MWDSLKRKLSLGKGGAQRYASWDDVRRTLPNVLKSRAESFLFELFIERGLPPTGNGSLTVDEASRLKRLAESARSGMSPGPADVPVVAQAEARRRIGNWLTNATRSDMASGPRSMTTLVGLDVLGDPPTVSAIRSVYDCYINDIFEIHGGTGSSERVRNLQDVIHQTNSRIWDQLIYYISDSAWILVSKEPISFENACVIPNLRMSMHLSPGRGMIFSPNRSLVLFQARLLEEQSGNPIDAPLDIQRLMKACKVRGWSVESLWLP